jgi:hypothetical protein
VYCSASSGFRGTNPPPSPPWPFMANRACAHDGPESRSGQKTVSGPKVMSRDDAEAKGTSVCCDVPRQQLRCVFSASVEAPGNFAGAAATWDTDRTAGWCRDRVDVAWAIGSVEMLQTDDALEVVWVVTGEALPRRYNNIDGRTGQLKRSRLLFPFLRGAMTCPGSFSRGQGWVQSSASTQLEFRGA